MGVVFNLILQVVVDKLMQACSTQQPYKHMYNNQPTGFKDQIVVLLALFTIDKKTARMISDSEFPKVDVGSESMTIKGCWKQDAENLETPFNHSCWLPQTLTLLNNQHTHDMKTIDKANLVKHAHHQH